MAGHTFKRRGKITEEDQERSYNQLVRNQSPKAIQDFIVENFKGQGNTDIRPDIADINSIRYLLALSLGGSDAPVGEFFGACFEYFQRHNTHYNEKLMQLEVAAKNKLVKE